MGMVFYKNILACQNSIADFDSVNCAYMIIISEVAIIAYGNIRVKMCISLSLYYCEPKAFAKRAILTNITSFNFLTVGLNSHPSSNITETQIFIARINIQPY